MAMPRLNKQHAIATRMLTAGSAQRQNRNFNFSAFWLTQGTVALSFSEPCRWESRRPAQLQWPSGGQTLTLGQKTPRHNCRGPMAL